ncbi:ABC transporter substrate-binding protein [Leifsonia sp. NPDC058230]|uniref:ABC transporter substrate-binding protein n=1 Tax=Leifsonia sp. NPDC058230 TaxID=3346391 RepID=UPI0036DD669A
MTTSRRRTILAAAAVAVTAALALTSCSQGGSKDAAAGSHDINLKWALAAAPRGIDMYADFSSNANVVDSLVYESLVKLDNLKLEPSIATKWVAKTPTTYVYTLRDDATFSDGNPVTADDVAYSFNRHIAEGSTSASVSHLKTLKEATVTGKDEVTIELTKPDATWIYDPLFAPIVEKSVVEEAGAEYGAPGTTIVGSGPYTVTSFDASTGITLKRNDKYWGKKPAVASIDFSYIADPSALSLALRSGDVDGFFGVPLSKVSQFKNVSGVSIVQGEGLATASLMFDVQTKPFDDIHVRKAIASAWDAASFTKNVLGGYAKPANAIASPGFWTNLADKDEVAKIYDSIPTIPFDLKAAKAELAKSSVPDGFTTSISYPDSRPELGQALQVLAENLKSIGITLNVKEIPYQQWVTLISGSHDNLTIQIAQWNPDYPDPSDFILSQYPSSHAVPNQYNLSNYKNPEVDAMIDSELASTDSAERVKLMTSILQTVAKDVPNVNLYWPSTLMAIRSPYQYSNYNGMYYSEQWVDHITEK